MSSGGRRSRAGRRTRERGVLVGGGAHDGALHRCALFVELGWGWAVKRDVELEWVDGPVDIGTHDEDGRVRVQRPRRVGLRMRLAVEVHCGQRPVMAACRKVGGVDGSKREAASQVGRDGTAEDCCCTGLLLVGDRRNTADVVDTGRWTKAKI